MPRGARPARIEWRAIAVTAADPTEFASTLQHALQGLSDAGFSLAGQYQRGTGHILLGQRVVQEQEAPGPTIPPPPPLARPTGSLATLRAQAALGQNETSFFYHFISPDGPQHVRFTSMVEALRLVREHVDGDGGFVPGYLVAMAVTTFEAPALSGLLKAYAEELAGQPPKQVD